MQARVKKILLEEEALFEMNGFTAQFCYNSEMKRLAYHLRYEAYVQAGMIPPSDYPYLMDSFDAQTNARIHLLWYEDTPIATVRSSIWSERYNWEMTESVAKFQKEIAQSIGVNERILESSRYAVAPTLTGRKSLFAQLLLFRIQDLSAQYDECAHIITSVRTKHVPFYQRMLGFQQISEPAYFSWIQDSAVLLTVPTVKSRQTILDKGMPPCTTVERDIYCQHVQKSIENGLA
ncbi:MAG: hypothetical protein AAFQ83_20240 [Bacteroidota bacterium]